MKDIYGAPSAKGRILSIAATQYGVLSRRQALGAGMSPRSIGHRLRTGEWQRVHQGIYRLTAVPSTWHQTLMAAYLWAGEQAVVSHRAAAALWRLDGTEADRIELSTTRFRHSPPGFILHCTDQLPRCDVTTLPPFRITTVSRTLVDLGAVLEMERVEAALDDALRRRLTTISRLHWRLDELGVPGRRGVATLRKLLDARRSSEAPAESALERRLLRLLSRSGLPAPVRQHEVKEKGRVIARIDLAYPKELLAIEADGYRYHSGRREWQKDLLRGNALTSRGWRTLHVTWEDVTARPADVVQLVQRLLERPRSF